jgi:hypothetical protein
LGLVVLVGLAVPSVADAQRRSGGGGGGGAHGGAVARSGGAVHSGGAVVRGGGVYRGNNVAVPRAYGAHSYYRPSYNYRPYYAHNSYYRPYYPGYYPYYYSPWSFSLNFGFGGYYGPSYAYPYYGSPYPAYPSPYSYSPPYPYPPQNPSQPQDPSPTGDNGYNNTLSTPTPNGYQPEGQATTARGDGRKEFGTLSIRVMPSDATILIDHQAWDRPTGDDRFSIDLIEGPHQVEIRKAGYATYARTIDVPRGRSAVVNVALSPGGTGTMQVARTVPFRH